MRDETRNQEENERSVKIVLKNLTVISVDSACTPSAFKVNARPPKR
jgi:hypothetical protein